ncbi:SMP-30/gluconolactonase/LRE family protein [Massilia sp. R2A-15]|uniref:SMP-30/gluconolactonase/LRE family protein n=1 Tax=Massilia sp. R2A-15 TaxID=3064278 RepID=UPI002734DD97|nr:SMP-30/gluconolactonase/LRE family protein [Massilia sp. R2A-15]WLI87928.1 SMP-30/gluconolactonase/LRE family protein [Massilia sp. R2A-15]
MSDAIEVAYDQPMAVGECPLWNQAEACLYWVDIDGFAIHRLDPASGAHRSWAMESEPAAIGLHAGGGLVVALRSGFAHFDTGSGALTPIAPAPYDTGKVRFNDGRVDAAGRFWVGTLYEPRTEQAAEMYCLERGQVRLAWSGGMTVSNGLGFSPDRQWMYHSDTTSHRIDRYPFDAATGNVGEAQPFQRFSTDKAAASYGGRPDGAAVDSEGAYWSAMFEGGRLLRLSSDGELLREVVLPVRAPTMMAFGGPDLRTLYITSAGTKRPADERARYPLSGCVLSMRVDVPGLPEPLYQP